MTVRQNTDIYPIVYLDALVVKVRDNGQVQNKSVYVVLGVTLEGEKELLGLWIAPSEGAKFWLAVLTELKNRGVQDIFIACGATRSPETVQGRGKGDNPFTTVVPYRCDAILRREVMSTPIVL